MLYPCTTSASKAASAGAGHTDEDLTHSPSCERQRATMTHIQILPPGKAPVFHPVLDATDVVPASGTFSRTI